MVLIPSFVGKMIGASWAVNSVSIWRQAPQGELGALLRLATATAAMRMRGPNSLMARTRAERSAQMVRPKLTFSTLVPVTVRPLDSRRAEPTLNPE